MKPTGGKFGDKFKILVLVENGIWI